MKNIFNRTIVVVTAIVMALMTSCNKPDMPVVQNLEVNASNLHGMWELSTINSQPLKEGTYFRITFDRSGNEFEITENLTSIPSSFNYSEGTFKLYVDPEAGTYIRGIDTVKEEWNDTYVIKELTSDSMKWIGMNDPDFVQVFIRVD